MWLLSGDDDPSLEQFISSSASTVLGFGNEIFIMVLLLSIVKTCLCQFFGSSLQKQWSTVYRGIQVLAPNGTFEDSRGRWKGSRRFSG